MQRRPSAYFRGFTERFEPFTPNAKRSADWAGPGDSTQSGPGNDIIGEVAHSTRAFAGRSPLLPQNCANRAGFALSYLLSPTRVERRRKDGNTGGR